MENKELHRITSTAIIYYDLVEGLLEEIEMVDKILKGENMI